MPSIGTVSDLKSVDLLPEKRDLLREPYLDMVRAMKVDRQPRELKPGEGETLRKLKVNVTRAANEVGLKLGQRETREGSLVVYVKPDPKVKASTNGTAVASAAHEDAPEAEEEDEAIEAEDEE